MRREALASKLYYDESLAARPAVKRRERNGWWRLARLGACCILAMTLLVITYLGLCTRIVEEQYALDRCQAQLPALQEQNADLEVQVKALGRLSRIDAIARNELHMGFPKERLVIQEDPEFAETSNTYFAWRTEKKIAAP